MAPYAALMSLTNTIEQIQDHRRLSASVDKNQTESLVKLLNSLQDFLENCSKEATQVLESQIASAVYAAEDTVESHIVDQINSESISLLDLTNVIEEMDSIHQKALKVQKEMGDKKSRPTFSTTPAASSRHLEKKTTNMVGFDDQLVKLMDKLAGGKPNRQIVLIDGMGGIGKTTLAQNAFENKLIVEHFDIRSWVTVSQTYSEIRILCDLLSLKKEPEYNEMDQKMEEAKLGEQLYEKLFGRRYLVILDDMWSLDAWYRIRSFLPDNDNGSRVAITTRESHLSNHLECSRLPMKFLDEDQSWELFCQNVFGQEGCPPEFEKIGKEIAQSCKRLPLSISVISGLLRKSSRTLENWENIAKDINSILISSGEDKRCSNILTFSYDYMPAHLKPCFLYMGIFSENSFIFVSRLIKLWVAEGFIKPNKSQSLKAVAKGYFQDLLDRNLILVYNPPYFYSRAIKFCKMHDLVRDLCLATAEKDNFHHVVEVVDLPRAIDSEHHRRIVIHQTIGKEAYDQHGGKLAIPLVRSLICNRGRLPFKSKLLRVLSMEDNDEDSPEAIFDDHVNLRYLAYYGVERMSNLPSSIFRLWNLQTLIVGGNYCDAIAPIEIWEMRQLRHIHFDTISLSIPPGNQRDDDRVVLRNLQTLGRVVNFAMSEDVRKRIPNVKKVDLRVDDIEFQHMINFEGLDELETLKLYFDGVVPNWGDTPSRQLYKWPTSLKKLDLRGCNLRWEDLTTIGSLPLLEDLLLGEYAVSGAEWSPIDGEFLSLKSLEIWGIKDLIRWNAESSHFPKLEDLRLTGVIQLEEIPLDIGNIPTLEYIQLWMCSVSSAISAVKIFEEQEGYGNQDLTVRIFFHNAEKLEKFKEVVAEQENSFTSNRFFYCCIEGAF